MSATTKKMNMWMCYFSLLPVTNTYLLFIIENNKLVCFIIFYYLYLRPGWLIADKKGRLYKAQVNVIFGKGEIGSEAERI